jgi:DNA-binding transcriptional regulator GbsR (MarR family)
MAEQTGLSPAVQSFILHWGELGTRWGINRTVAQVHALLYVSSEPLDAGTISERLGIARSNASTSLRELQGWGIVRIVHVLGDRRDHFAAVTDVWEMVTTLVAARKRREIDPTLDVLRECAERLQRDAKADPVVRARIAALLSLFETVTSLLDEFLRLPPAALRGIASWRGRLKLLFKSSRA